MYIHIIAYCLLSIAYCLLHIACCLLPIGDLRLLSALINHQSGSVAQSVLIGLFTLNGQDELLRVLVRFSDCIAQEFELICL